MPEAFAPDWCFLTSDDKLVKIPYFIAVRAEYFREFICMTTGVFKPEPNVTKASDDDKASGDDAASVKAPDSGKIGEDSDDTDDSDNGDEEVPVGDKSDKIHEYWLEESEETLETIKENMLASDGKAPTKLNFAAETVETLVELYEKAPPEMLVRYPYTKDGVLFEVLDGQSVPTITPEDITATDEEFGIIASVGESGDFKNARIRSEQLTMLGHFLGLEYATVIGARCVSQISASVISAYYKKVGQPKSEDDIQAARLNEREVLGMTKEMEEAHVDNILGMARGALFRTEGDDPNKELEFDVKLSRMAKYIENVADELKWNRCVLKLLKSVPDIPGPNLRDRTDTMLEKMSLLAEGEKEKPFNEIVERILRERPVALESQLEPFEYKPVVSLEDKDNEEEFTRIGKASFEAQDSLNLWVLKVIDVEFVPCLAANE